MTARTRRQTIGKDDLRRPFEEGAESSYRPVMSPAELAELCGLSPKTIYAWIERGRLDGAFRKRGKHILIWRDSALDLLFNGAKWSND